MQADAIVSSRPIVISCSKDQVFPSSGPLKTSRMYILLPNVIPGSHNFPGEAVPQAVCMGGRASAERE
jgi:hypothetical protein